MPLLNYTTEVPVPRTVEAIVESLRLVGADSVMLDWDANKNPAGISFIVQAKHGPLSVRLPVDVRRTEQVLRSQYNRGKAPRSALRPGQPERVGWRIVKQWLDAQLALIEIEMVTLDQIFLPYAVTPTGQTVYERIQDGGGVSRLLGAGASPEPRPIAATQPDPAPLSGAAPREG